MSGPYFYMDRFQILKGLSPPEKKRIPEAAASSKYVPPGVYIAPILESSTPNRNGRVYLYPSLELDYNYIEQRIGASLGSPYIFLREEAQRYLREQT
jgi:hypothetical protein